jgi:hypothetical protein
MGQSKEAAIVRVGDSGGEYLHMRRGGYSAWYHVTLSAALSWVAISDLVELGMRSALHVQVDARTQTISGIVGALVTLWIYWNRWRCIEAFSSRFCSGFMGVSFIYVPFIAAFYAAYRGFRKLYGR